jgi:phosphoglycerate kinase
MELRSLREAGGLRGKRALLRASLNLPLASGVVRDRFRLKRALPTLRYLREAGARTVVVSHLGRDPKDTLRPVFDALTEHLPLAWGGDIVEPEFSAARERMADGDILLAENLRRHEGEEANEASFCSLLADLGEFYVNDAFAEAHRTHASTFGVARLLPAYAGFSLESEIKALLSAREPRSPSLFILGGAKFETKLPLVERYLEIYDHVFIGGALAHDIFKAKGYEVGRSLVSDLSLVGAPFLQHEKLLLPLDVEVRSANGERAVKPPEAVRPDESIVDAGPLTVRRLAHFIEAAATVLWNGPLGNYELGFTNATKNVAHLIAAAKGHSIVGGGDTAAVTEDLGITDRFGFASSGGGAMLAFLESGSTPAIDLLRKR